ncbi:MAG: DUF2157 domain-containing protein [Planctomycetota bacterium]|nr:DUF2157 domain-containing protein [Planctomycetota bacterium]
MSLLHNRWLADQLPGWEREGIVTLDGARRLRERYPVESARGLAQMIVGAVGALLVGTGLVAVLASNWDDFPRWVRLLLAFGPLAASQAVTWLVLRRGEAAKGWQREAAAVVQTLAAGAAMALVSQIYNLPGRWTELLFWWCLVSLPLAWTLASQAVAIAYLVGIAVWTVAEAGERGPWGAADSADVRIWFPILLAGVLPLWPGPSLRDRPAIGSRLALAASALVGLFAVAAHASNDGAPGEAGFWLAMLSSVAVLLFPLSRQGIAEPLARKPQVQLGGIAMIAMAMVASYEAPARGLVNSVGNALPLPWCWLLVAVVACFGVIAFRQQRYAVLAVAGLALVPPLAAGFTAGDAGGWPVAIAYSLMLLATAIVLIALEFLGRQGAARIGAALITLLVILRMADADVSLLAKGLAFIVIGSGFLGFNLFISRRRAAALGGSSR